MMGKLLCSLVAVVLVGWCIPAEAGPKKSGSPKVKVGDRAPDFSLRDLESNLIRLSDMAYPGEEKSWKKKKKVMLDFFRTDCKPCMKELPEVIKYHQKHKDKVHVVMIALLESEDGREKLDKFLKKNKIPFPVLVDAYETVAKKYIMDGETCTLPSIFFINREGVVLARFVGLKRDLESTLKKALHRK
jgi:peroxiredoxin